MTDNEAGERVFLDLQFLTEGDPVSDLAMAVLYNTELRLARDTEAVTSLLELYHEAATARLQEMGAGEAAESLQQLKERSVILENWTFCVRFLML